MSQGKVHRPDVVASVPLDRHVVVEASAGTGKTHFVEHLYVDRIVSGASAEEVLVVTFTEKAAREMRERIRARLLSVLLEAERCSDEGRGFLEAGGWRLDEAALRRLREAARVVHRAPISTIHAFCFQVLSERPVESDLPATLRMVDGYALVRGAVVQSVRRVLGGGLGAEWLRDTLLEWLEAEGIDAVVDVTRAWLTEEGEPFDACVPEAAWSRARVVRLLLTEVRRVLERRLREEGLVDFDGMVRAVDEALRVPGSPLLARLRTRYRHGLVDEFQDTSPHQWRIFRTIFLERPVADGATLTVVGDPKQAIYGFRGGDLYTYLRAKEVLRDVHGAFVWTLRETFRSGEGLADAFTWLFGELPDARTQDFFGSRRVRYAPVRSGRPARRLLDAQGRVLPPLRLICLGGRPGMHVPHRERGRGESKERVPRRLGREAIARGHLAAIAGTLRAWFVEGSTPSLAGHGEERPLRRSDVFVLCRTQREALEALEAIRRAGVAAALYKQRGLYQGEEAWALGVLLRALAAPDDPGLRAALWLTPYFGLAPEELGRGGGDERLERLYTWARLAEMRRWPELVDALERSGLVERQLALAPNERRLANLRALHERLLLWGASGLGLAEMSSRLEALSRGERAEAEAGDEGLERLPSEADAVQVMTVHASKGLEAEVVFFYGGWSTGRAGSLHPAPFTDDGGSGRRVAWGVPRTQDLRGGARPLTDASAVGEDVMDLKSLRDAIVAEVRAESARLVYVAATRARRLLVLPYLPAVDAGGGEGSFEEERLVRTPPMGEWTVRLGLRETHWLPLPRAVLPHPSSGSLAEVLAVRLDALLGTARFLDEREVLWEAVEGWLRPRETESLVGDVTRRLAWGRERILRLLEEDEGEPSVVARDDWRAAEWLESSMPVIATSFTGLQRQASRSVEGDAAWRLVEVEAETHGVGGLEERAEAWLDVLEAAAVEETTSEPEDGLPKGRALGVALHELLERLDWSALREAEDFAPWWEALRAEPAFEAWSARHETLLDEAGRRALGSLLFEALRMPVELASLRLPEGLRALSCAKRAVERAFRLWVPRGAQDAAPVLLEGAIDLVFEHEGRLYLLDWKSNHLPDWSAEAVAARVREHYAGQVAFYTLGLAAAHPTWPPWEREGAVWEARFGGVLYAFVRGMAQGASGALWYHRPSVRTMQAWWRALQEQPPSQWLEALRQGMEREG